MTTTSQLQSTAIHFSANGRKLYLSRKADGTFSEPCCGLIINEGIKAQRLPVFRYKDHSIFTSPQRRPSEAQATGECSPSDSNKMKIKK